MRIAVISFTVNGGKLNEQIVKELGKNKRDKLSDRGQILEDKEYGVEGYHCSKKTNPNLLQVSTSLKEWIKETFKNYEALIFIGATGIAVRSIAPFIQSKDVDPAVVVLDEKGENVISLLSGHIGGANELTREVAKIVKGRPIISTATDINHVFAIDEWASRENLWIKEISPIKHVASAFLNGEKVGLATLFPIVGSLPKQMVLVNKMEETQYVGDKGVEVETGVVIDLAGKNNPFTHTLHLIPPILTLGIGCRRGTSLEAIEILVTKYLEELEIHMAAVSHIATIDLKKDEEGLLGFCKKYEKPLHIYTSEELEAAPGTFTSSDFVKSITKVDNVCERAAVLGSKQGELILKKSSLNGVTLAIAKAEYNIHFNRQRRRL